MPNSMAFPSNLQDGQAPISWKWAQYLPKTPRWPHFSTRAREISCVPPPIAIVCRPTVQLVFSAVQRQPSEWLSPPSLTLPASSGLRAGSQATSSKSSPVITKSRLRLTTSAATATACVGIAS